MPWAVKTSKFREESIYLYFNIQSIKISTKLCENLEDKFLTVKNVHSFQFSLKWNSPIKFLYPLRMFVCVSGFPKHKNLALYFVWKIFHILLLLKFTFTVYLFTGNYICTYVSRYSFICTYVAICRYVLNS